MKNNEKLGSDLANELKWPPVNQLYRFGQFVLDPRRRTLFRSDAPVFLTPKAFDVLMFLAQNPHRLVTKEELLQAVWGDTVVEKGNLTQYISHLRKALGGNSDDSQLIVTIARKGYQFTGDITVGEAAEKPTQVAVQIPATESSRSGRRAISEFPTDEMVPNPPKSWAKVVIIGASVVILLAVAGILA